MKRSTAWLIAVIAVSALLAAGNAFSTSESAVPVEVQVVDTPALDLDIALESAGALCSMEQGGSLDIKPRKNICVPGAACESNADCRGKNGANGVCVGLILHCVCPE